MLVKPKMLTSIFTRVPKNTTEELSSYLNIQNKGGGGDGPPGPLP